MRPLTRTAFVAAAVLVYLAVAGGRMLEGQAQTAPSEPATPSAQTAGAAPATPATLVNQYCIGCHSERGKAGGLVLQGITLEDGQHAEIAEKVIRKLRGGLMPPAG